jgi:cytochrome c oxidase assembly factor CtaG
MNPKVYAFLLSWAWAPVPSMGIVLATGLYVRGWLILRRRTRRRGGLADWRAWCYAAGVTSLILALLSPIATYGSLFFFMHMIQHLLLMLFAAPFILLGAPLLPLLWALPDGLRQPIGHVFVTQSLAHRLFHVLTQPLVAMGLFVGVVAVWHVPRFYDIAQGHTFWHDVEHGMFFGTALLYWWPVIHPTGGRRRLGYGLAIPYLLLSMVEGTVIGVLLTFADEPVYQTYQQVPRVWGLSVVTDQQLGGLLMWIAGGHLYLLPVLILLSLWLKHEGDDEARVPDGA